MTEQPRIELHCHTKMSKEWGLIEPEELVRYAYEHGFRAVAITDCGNVQAFPRAYHEWNKLWEEYQAKCCQQGKEAVQDDFLKVIYGMEGTLFTEEEERYPILLYAKNDTGIRNLYQIVTKSHLEYSQKDPLIPRSLLEEHRNGLLVGAMFNGGEIFSMVEGGADDDEIFQRISYYDFLEVIYLNHYSYDAMNQYLWIGGKSGKPLVAASDAYYIEAENGICWDILVQRDRKKGKQLNCLGYLLKRDDASREYFHQFCNFGMPEWFRKVPFEMFDNQSVIADQIEYVSPLRKGRFLPNFPEAAEELSKMCHSRMESLYGEEPPKEACERLAGELKGICENGYAGIFVMWSAIVQRSRNRQYPVCTRGSVASSFVAYLCGITDVNPMSEGCGGVSIPVETFMGLAYEKEPDIAVNFAPGIQRDIQCSIAEMPGVGDICYAGTIRCLTERAAKMRIKSFYGKNLPNADSMKYMTDTLCGVKRGDGIHPGRILVVPEGEEAVSFSPLHDPLNNGMIATQFEYHSVMDNLLKLNILGYTPLNLLHELQQKTGKLVEQIPLDDEVVLAVLCDTQIDEIPGLPQFGSADARRMIREALPKTYSDLIKLCALTHGMGAWQDNQRDLVIAQKISLQECISSCDDLFLFLCEKGMEKSDAYQIMESVRKGRGLTGIQKEKMRNIGVSERYIEICEKIRYLFPKGHAASCTLVAWRLAYFKVYYPAEYDEVTNEMLSRDMHFQKKFLEER